MAKILLEPSPVLLKITDRLLMRSLQILILISAFGSIASHAQSPACPGETLKLITPTPEALLRQAKAESLEFIRSSRNYEPMYDFILEKSSKLKRVQESAAIPGIGSFKLTTKLRTGAGTINWYGVDGSLNEILTEGSHLTPTERWSRVDSIYLDRRDANLVVKYRGYRDMYQPYFEKRFSLHGVKADPDAKGLEPLIHNYFKIKDAELTTGRLESRTYGLHASTDVVAIAPDGREKLVYSSYQKHKNNRVYIDNLTASPDKRFFAIRTALDGTLDGYETRFYDSSDLSFHSSKMTSSDPLRWQGAKVSFFPPKVSGQTQSLQTAVLGADDPSVKIATLFFPPDMKDRGVGIIGEDFVYLAKTNKEDVTELRKLNAKTGAAGVQGEKFYTAKPGNYIESATALPQHNALFLDEFRGAKHEAVIVGTDGKLIARVPVSAQASLGATTLSGDRKFVNLTYTSQVNPGLSVSYDIANQTFWPENYELLLTTSNGKRYVSNIVEVQSTDDVKIPVRITHLANLENDGTHPGYMSVYGGFGVANDGVVPNYDAVLHDYLERGGVIVAPVLRGGDEFGNEWHDTAKGLFKHRTLDDIQAATDYAIKHGIVNPKKMIITGASNGGFTSAASGLAHPDSYGLVIPINGVVDYANAQALDDRFSGFAYDYGYDIQAGVPEYKRKISPVENVAKIDASKPFPEYLILTGERDSRVNREHSFRLYQAMKARKDLSTNINMILTPLAGHFSYSPAHQKAVGVATRAMMWTRIYDFLGFKMY